MSGKRITSTDIKEALWKMHSNRSSYFITECKTCSTYFPDPQGLLIFDGLAIAKSYTKPCIIGYEIKISRSDFLGDNKWHLYLQYCNEFYFVVPKGLIKKDELPDGVGLIYYDPTAKQVLHIVKKAQYRVIDDPVGVYKYIIFSRLQEDRLPFYEDKAEYAKAYLEDKHYKKVLGDKFGTQMAKDLQDAVERLDRVSHSEYELECWKKAKEVLIKHGVFSRWWSGDDEWLGRLKKALNGSVLSDDLDGIESHLKCALNNLNQLKERGEKGSENA